STSARCIRTWKAPSSSSKILRRSSPPPDPSCGAADGSSPSTWSRSNWKMTSDFRESTCPSVRGRGSVDRHLSHVRSVQHRRWQQCSQSGCRKPASARREAERKAQGEASALISIVRKALECAGKQGTSTGRLRPERPTVRRLLSYSTAFRRRFDKGGHRRIAEPFDPQRVVGAVLVDLADEAI